MAVRVVPWRARVAGGRVNRSKNTIVKPPKVTLANARQLDDIARKVKEAQLKMAEKLEESLKAATATKDADANGDGSSRHRSRSPSRRFAISRPCTGTWRDIHSWPVLFVI